MEDNAAGHTTHPIQKAALTSDTVTKACSQGASSTNVRPRCRSRPLAHHHRHRLLHCRPIEAPRQGASTRRMHTTAAQLHCLPPPLTGQRTELDYVTGSSTLSALLANANLHWRMPHHCERRPLPRGRRIRPLMHYIRCPKPAPPQP